LAISVNPTLSFGRTDAKAKTAQVQI